MNTILTGEETKSLDGKVVEDVNNAATGVSALITSEGVEWQIRVATDYLTEQLELLCALMLELRRDTVKHDECTSGPFQGLSGQRGGKCDRCSCESDIRKKILA